MNVAAIGDASLKGWKRKVVDRVADPVSQKTPLTAEQVRALVGLLLLAFSVYSMLKRIRLVAASAREEA